MTERLPHEDSIRCITFEQVGQFNRKEYFTSGKVAVTTDKVKAPCVLPPHRHDYYELAYTAAGEGLHLVNGIPYPVRKGDTVFLRLSDVHTYTSFHNLEVINCCFHPDIIEDASQPENDPLMSRMIHLPEEAQSEFETILHLLRQECSTTREYFEEASGKYRDLLLIFLKRSGYMRRGHEEKWDAFLQTVSKEYRTITLSEAAARMYVTRNYFCRIFRRRFGVTFLEYINQMKLQAVMDMLHNTDLSIQEIRQEAGFSQAKQFYQLFRRETGMTPSRFRRSSQTVHLPVP